MQFKKPDISKAVDEIKKETFSLLTSTLDTFEKESKEETSAFSETEKQNTEKWEQYVNTHGLTLKELSFLEVTQKEVIEMDVIKREGLNSIQIGKFKDTLITNSLGKLLSAIK